MDVISTIAKPKRIYLNLIGSPPIKTETNEVEKETTHSIRLRRERKRKNEIGTSLESVVHKIKIPFYSGFSSFKRLYSSFCTHISIYTYTMNGIL